ncbi:hypothetical protein HC891_17870 [Candidatus Gracilibacteria bacterium]|nr:hypothetical protein [Candidatus Gracilibacteria bacterium]
MPTSRPMPNLRAAPPPPKPSDATGRRSNQATQAKVNSAAGRKPNSRFATVSSSEDWIVCISAALTPRAARTKPTTSATGITPSNKKITPSTSAAIQLVRRLLAVPVRTYDFRAQAVALAARE